MSIFTHFIYIFSTLHVHYVLNFYLQITDVVLSIWLLPPLLQHSNTKAIMVVVCSLSTVCFRFFFFMMFKCQRFTLNASIRSSRLLIIPESNIENNETMKSGKRTNKNERKTTEYRTDNIQTIEPIINVDVNIAFVTMWRENSSRIKVQ